LLLRNPLGALSLAVLAIVVVGACVTPALPLPSPAAGSLSDALQSPSTAHLLGTDSTGRDILSRLLWGSHTNLAGALVTVTVAFVVGVPAGVVAGYRGGWFDVVSGWLNNLIMALPGIVLLLAVRAIFGPSIWLSMFIFGIILAPAYYRLVRAAVQSVRGELYIDAAIASGVSDWRILTRHVFAVVRAPIIIQGARLGVIALGIQAALEFLGIGDLSVPSWGGMLNEGFRRIMDAPVLVFWPSLAIGLVAMALVLLANAVRDALEDSRVQPHPAGDNGTTPGAQADNAAPGEIATIPGDALLAVQDLKVSYGPVDRGLRVVQGVSFGIRAGEVLGLVGESGSGKSQTAFAVLGLLPEGGNITGGSIRFDGRELIGLGRAACTQLRGSEIAYVPQEPMSNLDPSFTVGRQLVVPMRKKLGLSKKSATHRAMELLARVGIDDPERTFHSYSFQISGGMAQRVLIAGAVSCEPRLLIADEPTTALDVTVQAEVLDVLRDLQQENDMAMLLVTHDIGVVADICDRVVVMSDGRIVEEGDTRTVLRFPRHVYTASLLEAMLSEDVFRDDIDSRFMTREAAGS
jgi:ABC-type dipeptide/oligopeptide/nickel transport system ATPase component/ABC-type dipeptide/oligopeptide/nickel transport system permease subunit